MDRWRIGTERRKLRLLSAHITCLSIWRVWWAQTWVKSWRSSSSSMIVERTNRSGEPLTNHFCMLINVFKCRCTLVHYWSNVRGQYDFCKCFWKMTYFQQGCIYLIKNTVKVVILKSSKIWIQFKITYPFEYSFKCNLVLWYKADFSSSFLQSSVSHDLQKSF